MGSIYLVRHGQAPAHAYGVGEAVDGDLGLTDLGFAQARRTGRALAAQVDGFTAAISGELPRQRATMSAVLEAFDAPPEHVVDPGWDEYSMPPLVTDPLNGVQDLGADYQKLLDAALGDWIAGETIGEESHADYLARIEVAAQTAAGLAGSGRQVLVVSSAGTITALIASLWGVSPEQWPAMARTMVNASVSKVLVGRSGMTVVSINEHGHLSTLDDKLATFR